MKNLGALGVLCGEFLVGLRRSFVRQLRSCAKSSDWSVRDPMNQRENVRQAGYPQVAASQRLRRMLQQVRNRSRWGAAVMQRWRLLSRRVSDWEKVEDNGEGGGESSNR